MHRECVCVCVYRGKIWMWSDLVIISSLVVLSLLQEAPEPGEEVCEISTLFRTSVTIILIFCYSLLKKFAVCIISVCMTMQNIPRLKHNSESSFSVGDVGDEQEQDGTPLAPDEKSGIRIDVQEYSEPRIWWEIYGLGLASFTMLYSIQSSNVIGNAVLSAAFLCVSTTEFISKDIKKKWADNPLTSKISVFLHGVKSDYQTFLIIPTLLLLYLICTGVLVGHALSPVFLGTSSDGWYMLLNVAFACSAPFMVMHRTFPCDSNRALQISLPVSVMISCCFVSMAVSVPEPCAWGVLFGVAGKPYWGKILSTILIPVPAMLTIWTVVRSCNAGRTIDVGVIILTLSSLRILETFSVPAVLSCTCMAGLVCLRLYECIYPLKL